ncbi:MAG: AmmeMemoRadiSam system protein A [Desulfovibrio sp.]|nr:AmmeMemoRadiSam system protein A [Desulfovibrio sp.]
MPLSFTLSDAEKGFLSQLARRSIDAGLTGGTIEPPQPEELPGGERSALLRELGGFVTLTLGGALRGCIGNIVGRGPLYLTIRNMAQAAAFQDPRFLPLTRDEWPACRMEISVLDELTPCPNPDAVEIGRHGLLLQHRGRSGVFLPQVPVEQGWDRLAYLDNLCRKAGLPAGSWKEPDARLYWYEALVFEG